MSRDFNGTTSLIDCGSASGFQNSHPFTVMAWAASDNAPEGAARIVAMGSSNTFNAGEWGVFIQEGGRVRFIRQSAGTDLSVTTTAIVLATDGVMRHVALTWTGGLKTSDLAVYIDGVVAPFGGATNTSAASVGSQNDVPFIIGNVRDQSRTWDGRIAHVHFFRRVLTQQEIQMLMYHPAMVASGSISNVNTAGLIGYWPLYGFGAAEPDLSGCGNTGVITTAPFHTQQPPINEVAIAGCPGGEAS